MPKREDAQATVGAIKDVLSQNQQEQLLKQYGSEKATVASAAKRTGHSTDNIIPQIGGEVNTLDNWETPIPLDNMSNLPTFPAECLPDTLRDYILAVAESTQTSVDMPAVAALSVMAVCVQGKYKVMGKPEWVEPLNLYGITIANPAERKSAVVSLMSKYVIDYEADMNSTFAPDIAHSINTRQVLEKELELLKNKVAKGTGSESIEDVKRKQEELDGHDDMKPLRLLADDCSPEALTTLLAENDGKMAVISAEGGIFETLAGRYSQSVNVDAFLKAHCGDTVRVDRKGRPTEYIKEPCLTVMLSVQPQVLQGLMSNEIFRGRGLCARFLYSYPKSPVGNRKYETTPIPQETTNNYSTLCRDLLNIKRDSPKILTLSDEAHKLSANFANDLELKLKGELEHIADWAGKLHGAILRIAGILHVVSELRADGTPFEVNPPISADTFQAAINIGNYFLGHAKACYGMMGADADLSDARYILHRLEAEPQNEISKRDIMRLCQRFKKIDRATKPLQLLEEYGYLRSVNNTGVFTGGRPKGDMYMLNPNHFKIM